MTIEVERTDESEAFAALLLSSGLVTEQTLEFARAVKSRTGARIDEVLISQGLLDTESLLIAEAEAWGILPVDLPEVKFDDELVRRQSGQTYLSENWMPLRRAADGTVYVATSRGVAPERIARIRSALGEERIRMVATTSWDIKNAVLRLFRNEIADDAANELWRQNPAMSARITFSRGQKVAGIVSAIVLVALAVIWPVQVAIGLLTAMSLIFLAGTSFKFLVAMRGARYDVVERVSAAEVDALQDVDLPRYTVLVPVFREANIVGQLIRNLGGLDYPTEKLEVLILIEEEDDETREAVERSDPPPHFRIVTIPKGQPQTKPRACNVGLFFATGDLLVIYDAEDTPDPDQLKKAVVAFERGGDKTVCVQASLNYFNDTENALTRMFTLEYSYWFDYMLAGLDLGDLPIPLGGTSNHFRTSALVELGGWDPYNVTEDADLGIRASALGYRVGVINSTTMEEANTSIPNFVRQRSRWIKGYMQTTLVHARQPMAIIREIGLRRFLAFVLLIAGTPLTFLGVIPFYTITAITLFLPMEWVQPFFPLWLIWLTLLNFVIGNVIMIYLSMMGPYKRGTFHLVLWALLNPVYWLLHSVASYKALWQLLTKPHYWEKTEHGLTTHVQHAD
ncbi:glycosyltransferase [Microcella daejeonensis]|uniref:Glycosyltransferase n=1 Tax=Microcella daejeonensis TaxID=2994971 RepID=A0A9E8MKC5_9MICO|nr:glycosyltransferase [Microcella daejeonensis]WAB81165.1 glycosyltransferase [Microcella daejeonensis]WAB83332.1 glycosyltransferase [Microcella daejeonensis]